MADKHAFLYENGTMYDLNNLIVPGNGVFLEGAVGVNDNGQIIANGFDDNGSVSCVPPDSAHRRSRALFAGCVRCRLRRCVCGCPASPTGRLTTIVACQQAASAPACYCGFRSGCGSSPPEGRGLVLALVWFHELSPFPGSSDPIGARLPMLGVNRIIPSASLRARHRAPTPRS